MTTFPSLKDALKQPFAPECIQFVPKDIQQEKGKLVCLALPVAKKQVYEDRLNELVFGEWSTPYTAPYATDKKLIIPATVIILGIAHTDYGEAPLTIPDKNGTMGEDEHTAAEAYSHAFRRACAKFLLGRYLSDLPALKLPYDPKTRQIAISNAERIAWVETLYMQQGLLPRGYMAAKTAALSAPQEPTTIPETPPPSQDVSGPSQQTAPTPSHPTAYPDESFLDWVCCCVDRDPKRIQDICVFYSVQALDLLSATQRTELTRRLQKQIRHQQLTSSPAAAQPAV